MTLDLSIFDNMKQPWFTGQSNRHSKKCVSNYLDIQIYGTPKIKLQNNIPKQEILYFS